MQFQIAPGILNEQSRRSRQDEYLSDAPCEDDLFDSMGIRSPAIGSVHWYKNPFSERGHSCQ
ncbi:hypothetical protein [Solimonas flava]|uniref:hypothetical protein n=1 Tax=Solimonas flava TaxID=415849 RepID=UPI0012B5FBEE|nr:hypothetical protein [Solimonas flava]